MRRESLNFKAQAERDLAAQTQNATTHRGGDGTRSGREVVEPEAELVALPSPLGPGRRRTRPRVLAAENLAKAGRIAEAMEHGRDAKSLSPETRAYRRAVAEKSRTDKAAAEAKLRRENAALAARLAGTGKYPDPFF